MQRGHYHNQRHNYSPQYQRFRERGRPNNKPTNDYYEDNYPYSSNEFDQRRGGYKPPNVRDPKESIESPTYKSFIADDRDFYEVGKAILLELEEATYSIINEREKSVATVLQLHKMLSIKELNDFNHALTKRVKGVRTFHNNHSQIDAFAHTCERMFGEELRMLILQKGSISPFLKSAMKQSEVSPSFDWQHFKKKFHQSPEVTRIDLTDHIIHDEDDQKSPSSPFHNAVPNDDIFQGFTSATTTSSDENENDSEIYTIELMDIEKGRRSPTSNQQSSSQKDKRSPSKVRFVSNIENTSKEDRKNAISSNRKEIYRTPGMRELVEVVAPATLPENFMFEARIGDEIFMVVVPKGGVRKGEIFESIKVDIDSISMDEPISRHKKKVDMKIPLGYWRNGLFDCFRYGIFHPMLLNSIFCPHVALAQIMARLKLNFSGEQSIELRSRIRVSTVIFIPSVLVTFNALLMFLAARAFYLHLHHIFRVFFYSSILVLIIDAIVVAYFYIILIRTRRRIRYDFNIPVDRFGEDVLLSIFCLPCMINQMGQHTGDYDTYVANCCSNTGFSRHVELKLPNEIIRDNSKENAS